MLTSPRTVETLSPCCYVSTSQIINININPKLIDKAPLDLDRTEFNELTTRLGLDV